jgi:BlaI family penicillinase repressor
MRNDIREQPVGAGTGGPKHTYITIHADPQEASCKFSTTNVTLCSVMTSNSIFEHDPADLGELERAVMRLVWQHGDITAERVREQLSEQDRLLKDSTIRTVLRRLEEKGYVTHAVENRTFRYRPAESRQLVAGRAVKRIIDRFCDGSVEALLVGMVDSDVLDRNELQRLAERIAAAKKGKKA